MYFKKGTNMTTLIICSIFVNTAIITSYLQNMCIFLYRALSMYMNNHSIKNNSIKGADNLKYSDKCYIFVLQRHSNEHRWLSCLTRTLWNYHAKWCKSSKCFGVVSLKAKYYIKGDNGPTLKCPDSVPESIALK